MHGSYNKGWRWRQTEWKLLYNIEKWVHVRQSYHKKKRIIPTSSSLSSCLGSLTRTLFIFFSSVESMLEHRKCSNFARLQQRRSLCVQYVSSRCQFSQFAQFAPLHAFCFTVVYNTWDSSFVSSLMQWYLTGLDSALWRKLASYKFAEISFFLCVCRQILSYSPRIGYKGIVFPADDAH